MSLNVLIFIILIFLLSIKSPWIENVNILLNSLESSDLPKGKRRWSKLEGDDQKWEDKWEEKWEQKWEEKWEEKWEAGKRKWESENMLDRGETRKSKKYNIE